MEFYSWLLTQNNNKVIYDLRPCQKVLSVCLVLWSLTPKIVLKIFVFQFNKIILLTIPQEYSEDSNSEPDVDLENQYYNSKALKEDDPRTALDSFQRVC